MFLIFWGEQCPFKSEGSGNAGNDFFFETLRLADQHEYVWGLLLCIIGSQGCLLFNLPPEGGGEFKQTAALSLQLVAAANSANNSQQISSAA